MPAELIENLPAGTYVFIDANIFIYAFLAHSNQCRSLRHRGGPRNYEPWCGQRSDTPDDAGRGARDGETWRVRDSRKTVSVIVLSGPPATNT